jgi:TIR domain
VSGYEYDVFISYSRGGNAFKWVRNHFHPRLVDCLGDQLDKPPAVFLDREMERGVHWPTRLENALRGSKILIAVYTPPYFRSRWCMAEWQSMRDREESLGLTARSKAQGLIVPILYSDSDNFPPEARERSWFDFKQWAVPDPVYQETREWPEFHRKVEAVAIDLAKLLPQVPDWQPGWPVNRPDPPLPPPVQLPRF